MSKSEKLVREPVCKLSNLYFLLFPTPLFTRIPRVSFRFYFQILNPNYEKFNIKPALNHHFHHSKQWQWIGTIIPKNGQDVPVLQSPFRQSHVSSNLLRVFIYLIDRLIWIYSEPSTRNCPRIKMNEYACDTCLPLLHEMANK